MLHKKSEWMTTVASGFIPSMEYKGLKSKGYQSWLILSILDSSFLAQFQSLLPIWGLWFPQTLLNVRKCLAFKLCIIPKIIEVPFHKGMDLYVASLDKCWKDQLLFFLHLLVLYFCFVLFFNLNCSYVGNLTLVCGPRSYLFIWCMLRGLQNFPASAYLWCHVHKSFRNFHIDFWGNRQQGSLTWENGISMECLTWVVSLCFFLLYQRYPGWVAI